MRAGASRRALDLETSENISSGYAGHLPSQLDQIQDLRGIKAIENKTSFGSEGFIFMILNVLYEVLFHKSCDECNKEERWRSLGRRGACNEMREA
jgi:hypothetical protein